MSAHSHIGASSMSRWSKCPGSVRLSRGIESVSSKYAEEGTLAHEIAADLLLGRDSKVKATDEMMEAICVYVDEVDSLVGTIANFIIEVEKKFDLSSVHPGLFGTADCVVYDPNKKKLYVYDYKHGAGISVEVENNSQLMYYGLGALISMNVPCEEVELVIVQPRCPHPTGKIRRWCFPAIDLIDFQADLKEFAEATEKEDAAIVPGDHCRFCPAAAICPALHEKALSQAKVEFQPNCSYDPAKLGETLSWVETLEAWGKQVREFAYREAMHGRVPPGFKLVQKRATRKWKSDEETTAQKLSATFGLEAAELYTTDLKSPAQIEKFLDREGKNALEDFTIKESSGLTLASIDDPREAQKNDVTTEFTKIT